MLHSFYSHPDQLRNIANELLSTNMDVRKFANTLRNTPGFELVADELCNADDQFTELVSLILRAQNLAIMAEANKKYDDELQREAIARYEFES